MSWGLDEEAKKNITSQFELSKLFGDNAKEMHASASHCPGGVCDIGSSCCHKQAPAASKGGGCCCC